MSEERPFVRGLLDTSVVVELQGIAPELLPEEPAVSAVTLAELVTGPHATSDPAERARRQERLQLVEAAFDPLPFDVSAARAYGRIYAAEATAGRKPRGRRALDLLIAATALANELPLYTSNSDDFAALTNLLEVVAVNPVHIDPD